VAWVVRKRLLRLARRLSGRPTVRAPAIGHYRASVASGTWLQLPAPVALLPHPPPSFLAKQTIIIYIRGYSAVVQEMVEAQRPSRGREGQMPLTRGVDNDQKRRTG
jgi:hypothetical protein